MGVNDGAYASPKIFPFNKIGKNYAEERVDFEKYLYKFMGGL